MANDSEEDKVAQFVAITGAPASLAHSLLTACDGSLEMAVNMHMEGVEGGELPAAAAASVREDLEGSVAAAARAASRPTGAGRRKKDRGAEPGQGTSSSSTSAAGGENDDDDDDDVRAPIPQRQETMIEAGYEGYQIRSANPHRGRVRTVFDGFRNFNNEARSYGNGGEGSSSSSYSLPVDGDKKKTLEELFKPPIDITFKGDWQSAREAAEGGKKWLLVNIQDAGEFQCQLLNRDVWSGDAVKTIVREHFIFWQQYKESEDAQRYMTFYPVTEWPHVSILDPRTGENLVTWSKVPDAGCFCELVTEFLTLHPSLETDSAGGEPSKKKQKVDSIVDANEDDQLAAAIQASLAESEASGSGGSGSKKSADGKGKSSTTSSAAKAASSADSDESDFEPYSEESSNLSVPTPVKHRSKSGSRAVSPEPINGKQNGDDKANKAPPAQTQEDWREFLGPEEEDKSSIMIRFPDGKRESKSFPCSSKFKALALYIASHGFPLDRYEIVTNFPRRILTGADNDAKNLKELGLFPQEAVFVQETNL